MPTYHHQAAHRLGAGLTASAHHADGTVEAVERADGFALAVQWHPEQGTDLRLFQALVQAAIDRAAITQGAGVYTAPVPG